MPTNVFTACAVDPLFSTIMATIQRQARTSGVSTEALGLAVTERLTSWFPSTIPAGAV